MSRRDTTHAAPQQRQQQHLVRQIRNPRPSLPATRVTLQDHSSAHVPMTRHSTRANDERGRHVDVIRACECRSGQRRGLMRDVDSSSGRGVESSWSRLVEWSSGRLVEWSWRRGVVHVYILIVSSVARGSCLSFSLFLFLPLCIHASGASGASGSFQRGMSMRGRAWMADCPRRVRPSSCILSTDSVCQPHHGSVPRAGPSLSSLFHLSLSLRCLCWRR